MNYVLTIIVFIVIFSVLILVHELGHFLAAKKSGIKVEEFGFGLPPRIWSKKKGETTYSINWIPFGGFVRMLGEDTFDGKMLKKKRSFIAQSMRTRVKVVIAGVLMNFILAWLLLSVGFTVGMQPLLTPDDVLGAVDDGVITLVEGEIEPYDSVSFPRVKIYELDPGSGAYKAGLRAGDVILQVNGHQVYSVSEYENFVRGVSTLDYEIYREGSARQNFIVEFAQLRKVIIADVIPDSPAAVAGLMAGDVIFSVNGNIIEDSLELIEFAGEHSDENLAYLIERGGERFFYEIQPENGQIGVFLSELMTYGADQEMSLYNIGLVSSVVEVKDEQYPWYIAPYKAFGEGFRLAKLTGFMIVDFVSILISGGDVPETVAGPVGIARLTHTFVQEGFIPVLRFVAILSLSLAVINILPFPALDGGRLFFIIIEFIIGRRINQRWESYVHALGYGLILLLILAVTYNDIANLIWA